MQDVHMKLNPEISRHKQHSRRRLFHQKTGLKFKETTREMLHLKHRVLWCWNFGHFGKQTRNTLKVLKCGAGEKWRRLWTCHKTEYVMMTIRFCRLFMSTVNRVGSAARMRCKCKELFDIRCYAYSSKTFLILVVRVWRKWTKFSAGSNCDDTVCVRQVWRLR